MHQITKTWIFQDATSLSQMQRKEKITSAELQERADGATILG